MGKIWFLYINDRQEGPFTYLELSKDDRLTPDTFAWKEGMEDWAPIGEVDELKSLVGLGNHVQEEDDLDFEEPAPSSDEEIVLEMKQGKPFLWLWILILLLIFLYISYEFFW